MPPADSMPAVKPVATSTIAPVSATLSGWGGGEGAPGLLVSPEDAGAVSAAVEQFRSSATPRAIARGMGRSYGDAAQLRDGFVLDTTRLKGFQLDHEHGTVTTHAGVTIGELLAAVVPAGWMVPVVPGTQHVTVGGAIASDIHGKNHGTAGTFGSYVRALGLLTAVGEVLELEPGSDDGLFAATVGGMGLTGVIIWARIALRKVNSSLLSVDTDRAHGLDDALGLLTVAGGSHRVAWLDLIGSHPGRGIVTRAEHLDHDGDVVARRDRATVRARATVPQWWPAGLLRASTVGAFNELRYRRSPRRGRGHVEPLGAHMFPLDALEAWPRLYGRRGFLQYQLVVPTGQERVLQAVIEHLRRARIPCFLAVLKDFGPANDGPLSFPIEGWTLALDLPRAASAIDAALRRCDELVAEAGGRVYLSKDARLSPAAVKAMYPRLEEWRAVRNRVDPEGLWRSDLALRTGLVTAEAR
jgi:decaprenylphospho-beta-D-ribofuranose 2-oxidase